MRPYFFSKGRVETLNLGHLRVALSLLSLDGYVEYRATKQLKYSQGTQRINKHMVRTNRTTRQGSRDP